MYPEFQVWDFVEEEMLNEYAMDNYVVDTGEDGYFHLLKVARFYPMMYLNLKDKHGNKLFYKDIVSIIDTTHPDVPPVIGVIHYENASFYVKTGVSSHYRWMDYEIEKLGNQFTDKDIFEKLGL